MSLPAVLYKDRLEIGFTHSNQGNGSKARQLVDLNGSHRASQYTMGGTVNSKVNDAGLMALIGNVKTLVLEASAIENEADILANDNDARLDIQLLETFGADIVNVQDFAQSILAAETTIEGPLPVEQVETLSKLIVDMAELRQLVLHADTPTLKAAMQSRVEQLIEQITETIETFDSLVVQEAGQASKGFLSPAIVLSTLSMLQQSVQHFNVSSNIVQRFEAIAAVHNVPMKQVEVQASILAQDISNITIKAKLADLKQVEAAPISGVISMSAPKESTIRPTQYAQKAAPIAAENIIRSAPIPEIVSAAQKVTQPAAPQTVEQSQPLQQDNRKEEFAKPVTEKERPAEQKKQIPQETLVEKEPIKERIESIKEALIASEPENVVQRPAAEKVLIAQLEQIAKEVDRYERGELSVKEIVALHQALVDASDRGVNVLPSTDVESLEALKEKIAANTPAVNPDTAPTAKPSCWPICTCHGGASAPSYEPPTPEEKIIIQKNKEFTEIISASGVGPFVSKPEERSILNKLREGTASPKSISNPFQTACNCGDGACPHKGSNETMESRFSKPQPK